MHCKTEVSWCLVDSFIRRPALSYVTWNERRERVEEADEEGVADLHMVDKCRHTGGKFWVDDRFSVGFNDQVKFATLKSKCRLSLTIVGSPSYLIATDEPTTGL